MNDVLEQIIDRDITIDAEIKLMKLLGASDEVISELMEMKGE